ncbi:MAG: hypothetical protein NVSMB47_08830 [Polyangiales bacterium]
MRLFQVSALAAVLVLAACKKEEGAKPETKSGPPATGEAPMFTKKAPVANQKAEETSKMKLGLTLDIDPTGSGKTVSTKMDSTQSETRDEEILAVAGDAITKLKVTYASLDSSMNDGTKDTKTPDPRAGKTYVVDAKDGKVEILGEDGKPTVPVEATMVEKDYHRLGKPDPIAAALPARTLKAGESVPELADAIKAMLKESGGGKEMDVSDVSATFKEKSGDEGVFDIGVTLGKTEGPMKMSMPLKGELHVRTTDGQMASMKLAGPVSVTTNDSDPKNKVKITGKGNMELEAARKAKS